MTHTLTLTTEQVDYIRRAIHLQQNRCEQRRRHAAKQLQSLRPEYQASKVRDSLLLAGGLRLEDLPGTSGDLRNAIRKREYLIDALALKIAEGGAILDQLEPLEG